MTNETDTKAKLFFAPFIEAFPDMALLARTLDVPHSTVAAWKRRDKIPESRWRSLAAAAAKLGIKKVTYDDLASAADSARRYLRKHPKPKPQPGRGPITPA